MLPGQASNARQQSGPIRDHSAYIAPRDSVTVRPFMPHANGDRRARIGADRQDPQYDGD
jgi:hypothetical protein